MIGRVTDEAIGASIAPTLRALYRANGGPWSRATIAQLAGLVEYGRTRPADPEPHRRAELAAALDERGRAAGGSAYEQAAALLVAAVGDPSAPGDGFGADAAEAAEAAAAVRAVLVSHLDDELAQTTMLLGPFRGRMADA